MKRKIWKYMIRLHIGSENILSYFVWDAKLKIFKILGRNIGKMRFTQDDINCPDRTKICCHKNIPGLGNNLVENGLLDHLFRVMKSWCFGLGNFVLEVNWVKIYQVRGMSWWQLDTLIICVGFWSRDVLDLEILVLEVEWVIIKMLSTETPSRSSDVTICQGWDMS